MTVAQLEGAVAAVAPRTGQRQKLLLY